MQVFLNKKLSLPENCNANILSLPEIYDANILSLPEILGNDYKHDEICSRRMVIVYMALDCSFLSCCTNSSLMLLPSWRQTSWLQRCAIAMLEG